MKRKFVKNKALLTLTVLLSLYSGTAFAATNYGYLEANGTRRTFLGNGTIIFSSSGDSGRAIYAYNGAKVTIGSTDTTSTYENITANGEVLAEESTISLYADTVTLNGSDGSVAVTASNGSTITIGSSKTASITATGEVLANDSTISLYADTVTLNRSSSDSAVTASDGSTVTIGNTDTSSITTTGEVLATADEDGSASNITLTAGDITMYYDPNPSQNTGTGGDEDHTLYADGGSNIAVTATGTVSIEGPIGAVDSDSSITVDGTTISITHNTVGTGDYEMETRGIHVEDGASVRIGSDDTDTLTIDVENGSGDSSVVVSGNESSLSLYGDTITITATDGVQNGNVTSDLSTDYVGGTLNIGSESTSSLTIKNDLLTVGEGANTTLLGSSITVTGDVGTYNGGETTIGSANTDTVTLGAVEVYGSGSSTAVDGKTIKVENGALATGSGASLTIGGASSTETLTGDLTATDEGVITATLSGAYTGDATASDAGTVTLTAGSVTGDLTATGTDSTLTADVSGTLTGNATATDSGTLTLTAESVVGNLSTSDSGTLTATVISTFTGMTTDDADTMTLNMESGSTWNLTDSSTVSTLNAAGADINLLDGTLGQSLTTDTFAGDGTTVYLDADGTTNTGNDRVYVTGTHTGTTSLHLSSTSNTWSGALGTVLVSVGDEQGSFVSDGETEAALYYYDLILASTTDNVTDGYSTDWYLEGFKKNTTDSEGHHTTVVRNLGGITGSNYLLWRSDMDTLFRRLGEVDNSLTENTDDGIWVRAKGKKFSRVSDFLVDSKYNEYEAGYDWLHDKTDKNEHVAGVGIAYLDGDSTYVTGKGDLTGYTLGLYDTTVWKDGQYLDLVLKGSRYKNEFGYRALGRHIDGKSDSTGLSLGAEYGYKRKAKSGWYVEPQAQFVLGYFRNDDFTDSNGVHVDNETIRTAIGRIGMRAGYEDKKLSAYAKANWYHDFGGNHVTNMSVGTDSLRVHEDYGDTWFAYGLGAAYKMNDKAQFYFDLERGDGSTYDENWSWDVGMRFSF